MLDGFQTGFDSNIWKSIWIIVEATNEIFRAGVRKMSTEKTTCVAAMSGMADENVQSIATVSKFTMLIPKTEESKIVTLNDQ